MKISIAMFICIVVVAILGDSFAVQETSNEDQKPSVPLINVEIRDILIGREGESVIESVQRMQAFRSLTMAPSSIARQVNAILGNDELLRKNPDVGVQAAKIAATFRLKDCVPSLMRRLTLQPTLKISDWDKLSTSLEEALPVAHTLIEIGKPSIPHILALAGSDSATEGELAVAGRVLIGVEGSLSMHVVEEFIKKSDHPDVVRKLLERHPFKEYWISKK